MVFPLGWGGGWFDDNGAGLVSQLLLVFPWSGEAFGLMIAVRSLVSRLLFDGPPLVWGTARFDGSGAGLVLRLLFVFPWSGEAFGLMVSGSMLTLFP